MTETDVSQEFDPIVDAVHTTAQQKLPGGDWFVRR
jgi:hypothetical protein